jgi:putative tail protein
MSGILSPKNASASNQVGGVRLQTSLYGLPIPLVYGRARLAGNLIHMPDLPHAVKSDSGGISLGPLGRIGDSSTTTQEAPVAIALCEGPIGSIGLVWVSAPPGQDFVTKIEPQGWRLFDGHAGQPSWSYLHSLHPDQEVFYPATAYVVNIAASLSGGAVDNFTWEVNGFLPFGGLIPDALPPAAIVDLLTDLAHGLAWNPAKIFDTSLATSYVQAAGLFASPVMDTQQAASAYMQELLTVANCTLVWSEGSLKILPYGDTPLSGNGATYTPDTTPIYDLTDNDFLAGPGEDPVHVVRKTATERYNQLYVEYEDRTNDYNTSVVEAKIEDDILLNGLKPAPKITLNSIKDPSVARHVAQLALQRIYGIRNTYQFRLGWRYSLLDPMDLVTLTDAGLGLNRTPVRITEIVELDQEQGFQITAEKWPFGTATATEYATQGANGAVLTENADPGNTFTPVIFDGPFPLPDSPLTICVAVSGAANWPPAPITHDEVSR